MDGVVPVKLGEKFKPSAQLKTLYKTYLGIIFPIVFLPWYVPLLIKGPVVAIFGVLIPVVIVVAFLLYWIPRFYSTISYVLTENEIVWRRGVWFKNTGIVPYNRITNVDIAQGPISRNLGIAALKLQTAGYSGQEKAEIKLEGIEDFEQLREFIMNFVRGRTPQAVESYAGEEDTNAKILKELTRIRELVENVMGKVGEK